MKMEGKRQPTELEPRNQRDVSDDEALTQFGTKKNGFRSIPRWDRELELSLISGRLTPEEACEWVRLGRFCPHDAPDGDLVRHTTAGTLRSRGFRVEQCGKNLEHVAAGRPGEEWDASSFVAAFTDEEGGNA